MYEGRFEYGDQGRMVRADMYYKANKDRGLGLGQVLIYEYDPSGNISKTSWCSYVFEDKIADERRITRVYEHDSDGRIVKSKSLRYDGSSRQGVCDYVYDLGTVTLQCRLVTELRALCEELQKHVVMESLFAVEDRSLLVRGQHYNVG